MIVRLLVVLVALFVIQPCAALAQDIAQVSTFSKVDAAINGLTLSGCISGGDRFNNTAIINDTIVYEGYCYALKRTDDGAVTISKLCVWLTTATKQVCPWCHQSDDTVVLRIQVVRLDNDRLAVSGEIKSSPTSDEVTSFLLEQQR